MGALSILFKRPDFRSNPIAAIYKRLWWRIRWTFTNKPWQLKLRNGLSISAPKGGAGALIYYQGNAEPELASFISRTLKPGMTFWDIGSHIGEYALVASPLVTETGRVEAFEPQPAMFEFLRENVTRNGLVNTTVHDVAISNQTGVVQMSLPVEPSIACLQLGPTASDLPSVNVTTAPLDAIHAITERTPDLIKVDVEGAELLVLNGAQELLDLPGLDAPMWVMEYEPDNCLAFGYQAGDLLTKFRAHGLFTYWLTPAGRSELILDANPPAGIRTVIATKGPRP
ncbi:MAG: FkbM family methyltransferase [Bryobacteraceae bacterium]